MSANKLTVSLSFSSILNRSPLSLPYQEDDAKVKEEEEPAPLTQLAHSSTLEEEVC